MKKPTKVIRFLGDIDPERQISPLVYASLKQASEDGLFEGDLLTLALLDYGGVAYEVISEREVVDFAKAKTFFGAHGGWGGPIIPLPVPVKRTIDEIEDKSMPLGEAVARIRAVTDGVIEVLEKGILLRLITPAHIHTFWLIQYR